LRFYCTQAKQRASANGSLYPTSVAYRALLKKSPSLSAIRESTAACSNKPAQSASPDEDGSPRDVGAVEPEHDHTGPRRTPAAADEIAVV